MMIPCELKVVCLLFVTLNFVAHIYYIAVGIFLTPCPAEHRFILFLNTLDPDQLASDEAI